MKTTTLQIKGKEKDFKSIKACKEYIKNKDITEGTVFIESRRGEYDIKDVSEFI